MIEELKEIRKDLFEAMEAKDNVLIGFGINRLDTLIHKLATNSGSADVSGSLFTEFCCYVTGHDEATINQMYEDWKRYR